ncbi:MAG: redoxin domain-containing protein [Verrucomicrobiae bacterium]|nr:redoxin domain-containing protein [Verrucomicrobiae bacterium]MDW8309806.1 redoxin domain-containing protein [Verrucomicrobiales bacterium]
MKPIAALLAGLLLAALPGRAAEVGQPAPDFTATDIEGKTHKLSDYKGKIVVLESYNLDCPFVANQYKTGAMQDLQAELTARGVVWFVVNSVNARHPSHRPPEKAKQEWAAQKMKATAWLDDSSGKIGRAYGMKTTPHMFVIAKDGTLAYAGAIDDKASSDHDPRAARNYVREAVEALLADKPVPVARTKPYGCSVKY